MFSLKQKLNSDISSSFDDMTNWSERVPQPQHWGKTLVTHWTASVVYDVSEEPSHPPKFLWAASEWEVRGVHVLWGDCVSVVGAVSPPFSLLRLFLLVFLQHLLDQRRHGAWDLHLQRHHPLGSCGGQHGHVIISRHRSYLQEWWEDCDSLHLHGNLAMRPGSLLFEHWNLAHFEPDQGFHNHTASF